MRAHIVTHHLEMTDPAQLRPARPSLDPYRWERIATPSPEYSRFLYRAIGGDWYWLYRIPWSRERWQAHVERPQLMTWVGYVGGAPAGYAELEAQAEGSVEILYFGVLPRFFGRGLGGALLTETVRSAWATDPRRVWLHTCNFDHPHALALYQARGFQVFGIQEHDAEIPDRSPGYWNLARHGGRD